ncbi:hypothetical protein MATL_G00083170 [Megalops atlanticus]|uniref:Uncharacterized protein n=1 Tax=Megalops atlanticus TaxID=7932 RepID=A0A9D3T7W3_MEGAT|nr:hypothetical protein MATL_G00083170 [Megalops atlanticus]
MQRRIGWQLSVRPSLCVLSCTPAISVILQNGLIDNADLRGFASSRPDPFPGPPDCTPATCIAVHMDSD